MRDYDTAPMYATGRCEQRLGHALQQHADLLPDCRVYTKSGRLLRDLGGEPALETRVPSPITDNLYHGACFVFFFPCDFQ